MSILSELGQFLGQKFTEVNAKIDTKLSPTTEQDIEITDPTKGIILNSPSGKRYRVTIDDNGNFIKQDTSNDFAQQQTPTIFQSISSLEFDGVDDRVQLASDFAESGTFTLSFWMKPTTVGSGNGKIYVMGTLPGNSNYIKLDQAGVMWLRLGATNAVFNEAVAGGGSNNLVVDEWQHIMFIRDNSNVISCYRNGASFGATVTNSNTLTLNSFGRIISSPFGFEGGLDEIVFWDNDQTSNISTIYNSGTPNDLSSLNPLHWYRFEEESGTTATDSGTGANNGILENEPTYSTDVPT